MQDNIQTVTVTLQTKELKYAIMNKTHLTARSLRAAGKLGYESESHMQASEEPDNMYELDRAIGDTIAVLKVELGEYWSEYTTTTNNLVNSSVEDGQAVTFSFLLTSNYNRAAADALSSGIHECVVNRSIYMWYRMTCPEIAEACKVDAELALARAKRALYSRVRPERPTCCV